jgi:menaquinol-cytochrome c reductase iron-sulfur subunit
MGQPTSRRTFMRWATHGLGALFAVVLGIPAIAYLIDPRNRPARQAGFRTVAKLDDLEVGKPKLAILSDSRRDAWTLHPNDVVGRVWLIRRQNNQVEAFTTICPHLGCSVNCTGPEFLCPCHGGRFDLGGQRKEEAGHFNPAPRGMDSLEVNAEALRQGLVQVKYENFIQGRHDKVAKA